MDKPVLVKPEKGTESLVVYWGKACGAKRDYERRLRQWHYDRWLEKLVIAAERSRMSDHTNYPKELAQQDATRFAGGITSALRWVAGVLPGERTQPRWYQVSGLVETLSKQLKLLRSNKTISMLGQPIRERIRFEERVKVLSEQLAVGNDHGFGEGLDPDILIAALEVELTRLKFNRDNHGAEIKTGAHHD